MSHPDEQPMDELEQAAAAEHAAEVERGGKRWAIGIVAAVVAVVALCVWRTNSKSEPTSEDLRADAKRACQEDFIPKRLKAPATAEFSSVVVTSDGGSYKVAGSVDSQNSFGAQIRSSFTCVMHSTGDTWVLDSATVS